MTHFGVMVLVPASIDISDDEAVNDAIGQRLAAYDENTEVEEYDHPCHCIGRHARKEAVAYAASLYGTIDEQREKLVARKAERGLVFPGTPPAGIGANDPFWVTLDAYNVAVEALWQAMIAPYVATEQAFFEGHADKDTPDPACTECHGTGTYRSTYNPLSKWDWWSVGGRFFGWGDQADAPHIVKVTDLPADWDAWAIVTANGEWHEKGKMGWWAMSSDEKEKGEWDAIRYEIISGHQQHYAALVDAHI